MATASTTNPYLEGNFAPVREERTEVDLPVTGTLPDYLDGRYLRTGPNPVTDPDPDRYHWFLGTGMVHGLRLRDGRAEWYRNRYVRSAAVAKVLREQPHPGPVFAGLDFAPNTNVIGHAGRTFALVESGPRPYELTDTLDTVGPCDLDGTLPGGYTAHPLTDPVTGEMHAISYFFGWGNHIQYSVVAADGRVRRTVNIEVGGSPMMHAFSLTEKYVVIYDLPVTFDAAKAASTGVPRLLRPAVERIMARTVGRRPIPERVVERTAAASFSDPNATLPYSWNPDYPARVGVMPREGTGADVRWFDVEPCYVYHPFNAYDDGDKVILDVTRHPRMFATEHHGPNEGLPTFDRWTVDLAAGKVLEDRLDDHGQEFPRVDERLVGRRHRYGYAVGFESGIDAAASQSLIKHDAATGTSITRRFGGGQPGEFVFVPARAGAGEDEGVVVGLVYDPASDRSDLAVLDAATLETVAEVHLPVRVPHGFHGNWVPSA